MTATTCNPSTDDRNSFVDDDNGHVARNVVLGGVTATNPLPTSPGETAIGTSIRITTMTVGDTPTKIPAAPLANRTRFSVVNLDLVETLYIGDNAGITADRAIGTSAGWEVAASETLNDTIFDSLDIYAVAEAGKTILIKILEAY